MNNDFGIYDESYRVLNQAIRSCSFVNKAILFGSRAMGNYKKGSDIDIALIGDDISFSDLAKLHWQLNEELPIPYFIDVVVFDKIEEEALRKHILEEGKVLYKKTVSS